MLLLSLTLSYSAISSWFFARSQANCNASYWLRCFEFHESREWCYSEMWLKPEQDLHPHPPFTAEVVLAEWLAVVITCHLDKLIKGSEMQPIWQELCWADVLPIGILRAAYRFYAALIGSWWKTCKGNWERSYSYYIPFMCILCMTELSTNFHGNKANWLKFVQCLVSALFVNSTLWPLDSLYRWKVCWNLLYLCNNHYSVVIMQF